jgi:uncharacterized protein (DUF2252 family)
VVISWRCDFCGDHSADVETLDDNRNPVSVVGIGDEQLHLVVYCDQDGDEKRSREKQTAGPSRTLVNSFDGATIPNPADAKTLGRSLRQRAPRSSLSKVSHREEAFDPVALLTKSDSDRVTQLIPLRFQRMLLSPLSFFRGSAILQATDLANSPSSGIVVQLCGDAHLSNFGVFSSPERQRVFDVNDFDETAPGPFEWDVKRLASSLVIAADQLNLTTAQQARTARRAVRTYRTSMRLFAGQPRLSVWYEELSLNQLTMSLQTYFSADDLEHVDEVVDRADSLKARAKYAKLLVEKDGGPRIAFHPPTLVPLDQFTDENLRRDVNDLLIEIVSSYAETLSPEMRDLLGQFTAVDAARMVVGVGSVGTRCYIILLLGRDAHDTFILQVKEANSSVLDVARGTTSPFNPAQRVVRGQRLIQTTPDSFLGWHNHRSGTADRSYYVRQLFDDKRSVAVDRLNRQSLAAYGELCAWTLARAHARGSKAGEITGYVGNSEKFDDAIVSYALAYKKRNATDFATLQSAAEQGLIPVTKAPQKT